MFPPQARIDEEFGVVEYGELEGFLRELINLMEEDDEILIKMLLACDF